MLQRTTRILDRHHWETGVERMGLLAVICLFFLVFVFGNFIPYRLTVSTVPSTPPRLSPSSAQFWVLFLKSLLTYMCFPCILGCVVFRWSVVKLSGAALENSWLSPRSYYFPVVPQVRVGHCAPLPQYWHFVPTLTCSVCVSHPMLTLCALPPYAGTLFDLYLLGASGCFVTCCRLMCEAILQEPGVG